MFGLFDKNRKGLVQFRIEGEFCEHCASKMEWELSKIEAFGPTKINYAKKTVFLPEVMKEQAQAIMEQIEPGVELVRVEDEVN